ncbi:MAG: preprotein translocase subunit SecE [bacterium]|nr:preprotein translocase subunit SecE [bacterium]
MASSHSNAARKKSGSRTKKTAVAAAEKASPKAESQSASPKAESKNASSKAENKKKSEAVATVKTAATITEIGNKNAGPGKIKLWTDSVKRFLKSVRSEMDRVTWPSWKELRSSTIVVVITLLLVSFYMGLVDWVLSLLFGTPKTGF